MAEAGVVVIGAGAGGLAAALDLAAAGRPVTVIERSDRPGGKVRELEVGVARIDSGPTVLTMKWVFDELFAAAGARFDERVAVTRAEVLARHAWSEGERLDLFADPARTADAIGDFAGAQAAAGFRRFCQRARAVYETLERAFLRGQRPTPLGLTVRAGGLVPMLGVRPFSTLWRELGGFFADPRLRQLFGRYATYCGSSPFLAPATLMLVAHVELAGVWQVAGGMQRLPEAMARLAAERGVQFRYGRAVTELELERGRITGVKLEGGERLPASAVVLNADVAALAAGLLGEPPRRAVSPVPPAERSLSALTLSLHVPASGFPLSLHNVFFSGDYEAEFRDLTEHRRLPRQPTLYVCAQDRPARATDVAMHARAPGPGRDGRGGGDGGGIRGEGAPERLFCIINAPATGDRERFTEADIEPCVQRGMELLSRCGLHLLRTPSNCRITSPTDFERRFPATGGALYGRATHGAMATFRRPGARTRIPGLYLAGGSVHPGPGVPMAALSGRLAAQCLLADSGSSARSRPAATPGGTSTR
ncbi:MAG: FAD-dependent oxidoreductase [Polyangia bacterium]